MARDDAGFLSRWSRRKLKGESDGDGAPADVAAQPAAPGRAAADVPAPAAADAAPAATADAADVPAPPPPSLADAEGLRPESDFRPFVSREVAPEVRNLAFRKLFADPHFNVMDGLDVYIDDYSVSTPVPPDVLARMAGAAFLNLVETPPPEETPASQSVVDVAQSGHCSSPPEAPVPPASQATDDDHADLRLQQDDAPGGQGPRRGIG